MIRLLPRAGATRRQTRPPAGAILALAALILAAWGAAPAVAQDSAGVAGGAAAVHTIRWYEPVAAAGAVALVSLVDESVADHFRQHRSSGGDDLADAARQFGGPFVYLPITAGVLVGGLATHKPEVTRVGLRLAASLGLAGAAGYGLKFVLGRQRPNATTDAYQFDPFTSDRALPSGHTTMAFALATSLADDLHRPWATVGLFGAATAVGVASVYREDHWVSDCVAGAAVGFTAAKLAHGRWRVFGIKLPGFHFGPGGAALGWRLQFHE